MFYIPNLPYAFYLAFRAKNLTFFTAANPSIKSSGNGTESKFETIQLIPEPFRPKSVLVKPKTDFKEVIDNLKKAQINFPIIAKPDIGFRGLLVKKINSTTDLKNYLNKYPIDIILQEFIELSNECGIFYFRNPTHEKGKISSVTLKKFLSVIGDGNSKVKELVLADNRARLYLDIISESDQTNLDSIPKKHEIINLSTIGNHCKGTQFINGNHLITEKLHQTFDEINKSINGWYYGRLDIKYNSFEELENGKNLKILEINGIIAEPTHIYDSENYTYFQALKEIRTHWKNLYHISITNHKILKTPYKKTKEFSKEIIQLKNYVSNIKNIN